MTSAPARVRGSIVSGALGWFRKKYGEPALQSALARLPEKDRTVVGKAVPSLGWYSVHTLERLLDSFYEEARTRDGITREEFDRVGASESGTFIAETIYRFLLSMVGPESFFSKAANIHNRVYENARLEVLENRRGYARVLFSGAPEVLRGALRHRYPLRKSLERAGAKYIQIKTLREEKTEESFALELEIRYE